MWAPRGGWWGHGEPGVDGCGLPRAKQTASGSLLHRPGIPAQGSAVTPMSGVEGAERAPREGMRVCTWLTHSAVQQKLTHCKATIFQLKKKSIKDDTEFYLV